MDRALNDLIERLKAAINDDERVALGAKNHTGRWSWSHGFGEMCNDSTCPFGSLLDEAEPDEDVQGTVLMQVHGYDIKEPWEGAEHIARHDPARTLAMVAAHRKILELHRIEVEALVPGFPPTPEYACVVCDRHEQDGGLIYGQELGCPTVLALAAAYGITAGGTQ